MLAVIPDLVVWLIIGFGIGVILKTLIGDQK